MNWASGVIGRGEGYFMRVYGPYTRKDGRMIVLIYEGRKRRTCSYPKWLYENHHNIILKDNEHVHHIDGDFTNNNIENLVVIDIREHGKIHALTSSPAYQRCVDKYGKEVTDAKLKRQGFKPGHIMKGAGKGISKSDEHKRKISKSLQGRKHSEETKQKMRN